MMVIMWINMVAIIEQSMKMTITQMTKIQLGKSVTPEQKCIALKPAVASSIKLSGKMLCRDYLSIGLERGNGFKIENIRKILSRGSAKTGLKFGIMP